MKRFAITLFLIFAASSFAQSLPDAPQLQTPAPATSPVLSRGTEIRLGVLAIAIASDGISSVRAADLCQERDFTNCKEQNPIARPFHVGKPGPTAAYMAISFAGTAFAAYELDRHHHPRLAHRLLEAGSALEFGVAASNLQFVEHNR